MKKVIKFLVFLIVLGFTLPVFAASTGELIPIDGSVTIDTDMFTYNGISYTATVEGKDYGRFTFESVVNKTSKQVPISIDIVLFDANRLNIGHVAYCTDEDIGGDYAQKKLKKDASSPLNINVTSKYFIKEKTTSDVRYYAVLDDNPYCHVGGYDKYEGLTLEEIIGGKVTTKKDEDGSVDIDMDMDSLLSGAAIAGLVIGLIVSLVALVIQGAILNALHKRMFASTTVLAYLPIGCNYVAVKLAFGEKVGKIYVIAYFASFISIIIKPLAFISYLLNFASGAAFIIVIIKLVTKKYSLCYLEPYTMNENVALDGNFTPVDAGGETSSNVDFGLDNNSSTVNMDSGDSFLGGAGQEVIDLNYSGQVEEDVVSDSNTNTNTNNFNYNVNDYVNFGNDLTTDDSSNTTEETSNDNNSNNTNNNDKDGESALMDLFK